MCTLMDRPWVMRMRWTDLLFAHWPVEAERLQPMLPDGLELDTFDGQAYLGIVPFLMEDVGVRGLPAPPLAGRFPELNVRTYVRHEGLSGVWFFSLDAANRVAVEGARRFFNLPYFWAAMGITRDARGVVDYHSDRRDPRGPAASLDIRYRPTGPVERAEPASLEAWLTDRPRLFASDGDGRLRRTEVRHAPWPLQPAAAAISVESMAAAAGIDLPDGPPHLRYSARLDVAAWWPRPV